MLYTDSHNFFTIQATTNFKSSRGDRNESSDTGRMNDSVYNNSFTNSSVSSSGNKRKFPLNKRQEERSSKSPDKAAIPGNKLFVGDIPLHLYIWMRRLFSEHSAISGR
jgi:hypothetical protein